MSKKTEVVVGLVGLVVVAAAAQQLAIQHGRIVGLSKPAVLLLIGAAGVVLTTRPWRQIGGAR